MQEMVDEDTVGGEQLAQKSTLSARSSQAVTRGELKKQELLRAKSMGRWDFCLFLL